MSGSTTTAAEAAASKARTRIVWTLAERTEWLRMFAASGKTPSEFCRENELPEATLSLWRRQQREGACLAEEAGFVEVALPPMSLMRTSAAAVTLHLPSGISLEIAAGTDAKWLATLVG